MTDEQLQRSAAFWLRAYPPAWRAERAAEVTAVLVDLAGDGARRLDPRTALGLLRGGIATRWRRTPPMRVYLPYRMLDIRVPARFREWVRQDISSPGNLRRNLLGRAWLFVLPLYQGLTTGFRDENLVLWTALAVAGAATLLCVRPDAAARRRLQHHARPGPGEPRELGAFVWVRTSRARIAGEPGSRALVLLLAVGAAAWSAAALLAPTRVVFRALPCELPSTGLCTEIDSAVVAREAPDLAVAPLVVVALLGLALAVVVARRLDRRLPARPDQPARHVLGLRPQARVGIALWIVLVVAAALAEATGAWVHSVSVVTAPVCLLLLPSAVAMQRRAVSDVAFVDLRHVAWTGRPVEVDRHDTELVPVALQELR
ncbi:hypothetical protein [uncultured Cellulomonas sp.]|uniref:hypothetical protein n=1 Tax=uncultured Cellulomonas sp. TaxID=189682 RepID=UPI0028E9F08E|nr:hypothetical protein [uncultured Cellulomonas sp.]